jgi:putative glutathione S-transferase
MSVMPEFASPVEIAKYGEYVITRRPGDTRPLYRFGNRITADGASGFPAVAGRYHLYAGWFCPWAQRVTIAIQLHGLSDVISVSYVDDARDARGWAFRPSHGPDPVNGFTLLRQAYEATEPGFDGHVSVPTLWDRVTGQVVSNDFTSLGLDIATEFGAFGDGSVDTYPAESRAEIDELDRWLGPTVNQGVNRAANDPQAATELLDAFAELDGRLAERRYLLGDQLTEADIRLFVTLVRYDVQANAQRAINPGLAEFAHLWAYARDLYAQPAFTCTTDFTTFTRPGASVPDWSEPTDRARLSPTERLSPLTTGAR